MYYLTPAAFGTVISARHSLAAAVDSTNADSSVRSSFPGSYCPVRLVVSSGRGPRLPSAAMRSYSHLMRSVSHCTIFLIAGFYYEVLQS